MGNSGLNRDKDWVQKEQRNFLFWTKDFFFSWNEGETKSHLTRGQVAWAFPVDPRRVTIAPCVSWAYTWICNITIDTGSVIDRTYILCARNSRIGSARSGSSTTNREFLTGYKPWESSTFAFENYWRPILSWKNLQFYIIPMSLRPKLTRMLIDPALLVQ